MDRGWHRGRRHPWARAVAAFTVLLAMGTVPFLWVLPASAAPVAPPATVTAAGGSTSPAGSAASGAAGNTSVGRDIVPNPLPGWNAVSPTVLDPLAARLQQTESDLTGRQALVAIEGWANTDHTGSLVVLLVRFGGALREPGLAARTAALDGCAGATGQRALSTTTVPSIAGSTEAICAFGGTTYDGAVVAWLKGDVLADVQGIGGQALTTSQIVAIAERQDRALPGTFVAASDTSRLVLRSLLGLVALLALVAAVVLVVRYLRRPASAPEAPPERFDWTASQYPDVSPYPGVPPSVRDDGVLPPADIPPFAPPIPATRDPIPVPELELVTPAASSPAPIPIAPSRTTTPSAGPSPMAVPSLTAPDPVATAVPVAVGWHPVDGDATHLRFWDGRGWAARLRWTGTEWMDVSS